MAVLVRSCGMRAVIALLLTCLAATARAGSPSCFVLLMDTWSRPVLGAHVTCDGAPASEDGHGSYTLRGDTVATEVRASAEGLVPIVMPVTQQPTTLGFMRRPGDMWLAFGAHQLPFVPERDKLLVIVRAAGRGSAEATALADIAPLFARLGLVPTQATIPPEVQVAPHPMERCVGFGAYVVLRRADGRPFDAQRVRELAVLRADPRILSAGPLVHRSAKPGNELSIGHTLRIYGGLTADELTRFGRDYGAKYDAATGTLTLRPSIGLEAVYVANTIAALRPTLNPELTMDGQKVCYD